MTQRNDIPDAPVHGRIGAIDLARTVALGGMVVFHFARDMEIFSLLPAGATLRGGWSVFASLVAGSFLLLAGVSLVLAHPARVRWRAWSRRLAVLAAAAAAVTLATWAVTPGAFVFFGILHSIAVASVLGLAFLRLPVPVTASVAALVFWLPNFYRSEFFSSPWLIWTGLAPAPPPTLDFEPVFPWFALFLAGMVLARIAQRQGWWAALRRMQVPNWLGWPGRHSLAIYLIHQPVLMAAIWLAASLIG